MKRSSFVPPLFYVIVFIAVAFLAGRTGLADSTVGVPETPSAIIDAMTKARDRLRSGSCRLSVDYIKTGSKGVREKVYQCRYWFDYDRQLFRFEEHLIHSTDDAVVGKMNAARNKEPQTIVLIRRPDMDVSKAEGAQMIQLQQVRGPFHGWDLRSMGLLTAADLEERVESEDHWRRLKSLKASYVARRGSNAPDGLLHLLVDYRMGTEDAEREYIIDPKRDYVPVHLLFKWWPHGAKGKEREAGFRLAGEAEVVWEVRNGIEVPISCVAKSPIFAPRPKPQNRGKVYNINIDWDSVNSSLSDNLFAYEGLDQPPHSHEIVDGRSGTPVIIQHPNVASAALLRQLESLRQQPSPPPIAMGPVHSGPGRFTWLLLINVAFIVLLCVALYRRSKRHRR